MESKYTISTLFVLFCSDYSSSSPYCVYSNLSYANNNGNKYIVENKALNPMFACADRLLADIVSDSTLSTLWYIQDDWRDKDLDYLQELKLVRLQCADVLALDKDYWNEVLQDRIRVNIVINCIKMTETLAIMNTLADVAGWNLEGYFYFQLSRPQLTILYYTYESETAKNLTFTPKIDDVYWIDMKKTEYTINYLEPKESIWRSRYWKVLYNYHCTQRKRNRDLLKLTDEFTGFGGRLLRVGTQLYSPFSNRRKVNRKYKYFGYAFDVLDALAIKFNFRYKVVRSKDKKFGNEQPDGTWDGVIGLLTRKKLDLIATGMTITSHRDSVVDFPYRFWIEYSAVIMRHNRTDPFRLFKPLHYNVWILCLICVICATTVMWLADLTSPKLQLQRQLYDRVKCMSITSAKWMQDELFFNVGAILNQGRPMVQDTWSGRLVLASLFLVGVLIFATYSGNLIASLSVHKTGLLFNTLEELAADREYTLVINQGGVHRTILESAERGIFADLWKKVMSNPNESFAKTSNVGIEKMFSDNGTYVAMSDQTSLLSKVLRQDRCDWAFLPEFFYPSGLGFALPEGSPYKDTFSQAIMEFEETGLLDHYRDVWGPKDTCAYTRATKVQAAGITFPDLQVLFVLLYAGILMSACVFAFEWSIFRILKCCKNRRVSVTAK